MQIVEILKKIYSNNYMSRTQLSGMDVLEICRRNLNSKLDFSISANSDKLENI